MHLCANNRPGSCVWTSLNAGLAPGASALPTRQTFISWDRGAWRWPELVDVEQRNEVQIKARPLLAVVGGCSTSEAMNDELNRFGHVLISKLGMARESRLPESAFTPRINTP